MGVDVRDAVPQLDEDTLAAFERSGWFLLAADGVRLEAVRGGEVPAEAEQAGTLVINADGRAAIATDELTVQVVGDLDRDRALAALDDAGLTLITELRFAPNLFVVRNRGGDALDASVALHDDPRFVFAEPAFIEHIPQRFVPTDPEYVNQWQWNNTGAGGAPPGPTCRPRRPGTTPWVPASAWPSSTTASTPATRTSRQGRPGSGFFTGNPAALTVGTAGMPDSDHGTFCAGMVGARSGNGRGGSGRPRCPS
ncbi:hypothetical protein G7085_13845 [Tessaracoccus sp. HDW20]|uniref:hypothetical protein n=1 Tax=Tessaracoccus coleopterorum TaxID=2714950 RepID=UPI0018D3F7E5|nr:hypothetical protein [Tessaracoccus coleopterorum]NHB85331.1 hypothetical protein [Tessaracoccus coleopterorum]